MGVGRNPHQPRGAQLNEPVVFPDTTPKPEGSAICINVGRTYYFKSANVSAGSMSVQRQAWKWKPCTGETERREQVTFSFTFDLPPSEFPDGELFELHMAAEVSGEDRLDVGTKFGYRQTLGTSFSGSVEVSMDKPADSGVFRFSRHHPCMTLRERAKEVAICKRLAPAKRVLTIRDRMSQVTDVDDEGHRRRIVGERGSTRQKRSGF